MFPFNKVIEDITNGMKDVMSNNPMQDFEKNMKIMLQGVFSKLDLVSREEFDVQKEVLIKTREKIDQLEQRLAELESLISQPTTTTEPVSETQKTETKVEEPQAFSDLASAMADAPAEETKSEEIQEEKPKRRSRAKKDENAS